MTSKQDAKKKSANPVDVSVGQRVKMCRIGNRVSQSELAKQLGVSFQQVQKYEKGANRIGAGRLFDIAQFFNVPIESLFPRTKGAIASSRQLGEEFNEILDFISGVDGLKLCLSFLNIDSAETRKLIVALVQHLGGTDKTSAEAPSHKSRP